MNPIRFPSVVFALFATLLCNARAEPSATASLSESTIAAGDETTLTIEISGVRQISPAQPPDVEGFTIRYGGVHQNMQIINGRMSQSITLSYSVGAKAPGTFTIPPFQIQTDAGVVKTEPVKLTVQAATPGSADASQRMSFAEITVPKTQVWLGESVPVEARLYVDKRIRWRLEQMPELEGEGFTKVKFPQPRAETARKDGRDFDVVVFKTNISPGKAGKVTLGPMELPFAASIPRAKRNRGRSALDLFDDGFFDDAFGAFSQMEHKSTTAPAIELDVKPLPAQGRPEGFSGAVGKFEMAVEGAPKAVKVGDPVTLKMRVSGTGNFDRVNAPELVDPAGWHPYEASGEFKASNELALSGTKSFEMAVVPEEKKTQMPQVRFSYFDPEAGKYVALQSDPAPLVVEGVAPPKQPVAAEPPRVADEPPPPPPVNAAPTDILGLKYDAGARRDSFEPLYRSRIFWIAQGVPLLGLIGLIGSRLLRKDDETKRIEMWKRETGELWRKVRDESAGADFFQNAARLVQIETARITGRDPATVDAASAQGSRTLDAETATGIDEIFSRLGELVYAGAGRDGGRVSSADRDRFLTTLENFTSAHAKK